MTGFWNASQAKKEVSVFHGPDRSLEVDSHEPTLGHLPAPAPEARVQRHRLRLGQACINAPLELGCNPFPIKAHGLRILGDFPRKFAVCL